MIMASTAGIGGNSSSTRPESLENENELDSVARDASSKKKDKGKKRYSLACAHPTVGYQLSMDESLLKLSSGTYSLAPDFFVQGQHGQSIPSGYSRFISFNSGLDDATVLQERIRLENYLWPSRETDLSSNSDAKEDAHKMTSSESFFLVTPGMQHDAIEIKRDKLTATYVGKGKASMENVRTNTFWKSTERIHYFEVTIETAVARGHIYVGLSDAKFSWGKNLGSCPSSFAYRSDDGKKIYEKGVQEPFGPSFGQSDIVGCGLDLVLGHIFYTLNGKYLGIAFKNVSGEYYPTATLHAVGETIRFNLCGGSSNPFVFDLVSYEKQETLKLKGLIVREQVLSPAVSNELLCQYLAFQGYSATLNALGLDCMAFASSSTFSPEWQHLLSSLTARSAIRQSILHGNIQNATRQVSAFFCSEEQQQDYSLLIPRQLLFPLKCQEWIELIRSNIDLEQRVEFITNELCKIKQQQPDTEEWSYLEACVTLAVYDDLNDNDKKSKFPWSWLLDQGQRERVADIVNAYLVLFSLNDSMPSSESIFNQIPKLDIALRQLECCLYTLNESFVKKKGSLFQQQSNEMIMEASVTATAPIDQFTQEGQQESLAELAPFLKLICSL